MKHMITWMETLSDDRLQELAALLDTELDRRDQRSIDRGYQRSTYSCDRVRGKRMSQRHDQMELAAA